MQVAERLEGEGKGGVRGFGRGGRLRETVEMLASKKER